MNQDGIADLAIGAVDYRGTATTEGGVWLIDGAVVANLDASPMDNF